MKKFLILIIIFFAAGIVVGRTMVTAGSASETADSDFPVSGKVPEQNKIQMNDEETVPEETYIGKEPEDFDAKAWNLKLVNPWNEIAGNEEIITEEIEDGYLFDYRAAKYLKDMLQDARKSGLSPVICSAYRTNDTQWNLFNEQVSVYTGQGYSYDSSVKLAGESVAYPRTSEHELGLAVDIVSLHYQLLDEVQESTPETIWLMKNCHKYGFILRYPNGKSDITGIIYEPWHYRYVGVEAATYIYNSGLTLEEFIERIEQIY